MHRVCLAALAVLGAACSKGIVVGADGVADGGDAAGGDDGGLTPLEVPWSTGFENGFGDWSQPAAQGFCYEAGGGTYTIVSSPVHSGASAAAFTVDTDTASPSQTRCVRQGVLPPSAYYGAWYYVPALSTNDGMWNLLHFQGADSPDGGAQGLWDVSLVTQADGSLAPSVYDFLRARELAAGPAIPIATWFHLEVLLVRSDAGAGELAVYLDGNVVLDLPGIATDDTLWGQWYVGNYATALTPGTSTLYVDDVTIGPSGP